MTLQETQGIASEILDLGHPLAVGPNVYKSDRVFASVLEGVFRRDLMTLETIQFLSQQETEKYVVLGSACMDLSRAILEDLVGVAYMIFKGKEISASRFLAFRAVELKSVADLYASMGHPVESSLLAGLEELMSGEAREFFNQKGEVAHRTWAKKNVEGMILELSSCGVFTEWEKQALLATYLVGNQKNHLSPMSIQNYMVTELFDRAGEADMFTALSFTTIAIVKMATMLIDEVEDRQQIKKSEIRALWERLLALEPETTMGSTKGR